MKRLKSRIDALERGRSSGELTRAEQMLLVSILGRRDSLFWPWRWQIGRQPPMAEIMARQRDYLAGVVGITVKADGRGDWKNAHEMRQRLIASGMIAARHSGGQVQSVFPSPLGEATARALVGSRLRTFREAFRMLAMLILRSKQTECTTVCESVLFDIACVGCPSDWDHMTENMLPLLTAGLVECHSDTQGRACYSHKVGSVPDPEAVELQVSPDPDFDDHYIAAFDDARASLEACEPRDPHEVYIPLPATGWGWSSPANEEVSNEEI
ncbi:MAG TPA: hypothetical protein DDZ51_00635 [Planctomycetaceae bacterium]|nr:hypothetical protein [Planctomycetaceae bacterium]